MKFTYIGFVFFCFCFFDEAGTDGAECSREVEGAIKSLFNARDL